MSNENKNLAAALVAAQQAAQAVEKSSANSFHRYKYASAEAVIAEARAALSSAGLAVSALRQVVEGTTLKVTYLLEHIEGANREYYSETPILEEKGRPLDKAKATAATYDLGYFLRGLLLLPRVEEGTDVDQRDDRKHEPKPHRSVPEVAEKDDSTLAENMQATLVSKLISDIHCSVSLGELKKVANDIKKVSSLDSVARTYLQEIYLNKRNEFSNGGAT